MEPTIYTGKNLMIDLETFSQGSHALIVQIGAVIFTKAEGILQKFEANIRYSNGECRDFELDYDTIKFWLMQDKSVIDSLFRETVTLNYALNLFKELKADHFWSKSTPFDFPILDHAFAVHDIKSNINFRHVHDMRDIYGFNPEYAKPEKHLGRHNALADAVAQADYVIDWMRNKT